MDVFEVIEQAPVRVREVPGLGQLRAGRIATAWADQKVVREIMPMPAQSTRARAAKTRLW